MRAIYALFRNGIVNKVVEGVQAKTDVYTIKSHKKIHTDLVTAKDTHT